MTRRQFVSSTAMTVFGAACAHAPEPQPNPSPALRLTARDATGERPLVWPPAETAIIVCDMWDDHWCKSSARRVGEIAPRMNETLNAARAVGVHIVHAPSDTLDHYAGWPQRERILASPHVEPPVEIARWRYLDPEKEKALPIDDSDGGCDDENPSEETRAWSQEHPAIEIADNDVISDQGTEIYNYFIEQGVKHAALMGVHLNMCVLGRSFGIRQLTKLGFDVVLVRDLTDTMYDPRDEPKVSHEQGTQLMIQHVEKHWAPSILSQDLTNLG
jgi:nicotinamidase-related amidase